MASIAPMSAGGALVIFAVILAETGRPVAAPSANPSGRISPTEADHVLAGLLSHRGPILTVANWSGTS